MIEPFAKTIAVNDDVKEVGRIQDDLAALWSQYELPPAAENVVSLALEEVLSNVLRHSRVEGRSADVRVTFTIHPSWFEFEVSDSAPPFNPLLQPDPDLDRPLEERRPGGLGIFLVKRLADYIAYDRSGRRNHLRFRKFFSSVE